VWNMVLSCLLWFLWREINDRSFEDRERTVMKLMLFLFHNYYWTTAFDLQLLDFLFLARFYSYILHVYLGCTFCAYNDISFTNKKEFEHEMRIRWQGVAKP
jgi:hypothetical protein